MFFRCYAKTKNKASIYTKYKFMLNHYDSFRVGGITIEAKDGLFEVDKDYEITITTIQEVL